jgi:hypothetical protein
MKSLLITFLVLSLFACTKEEVFMLNNEFSFKKGESVTINNGKSSIILKMLEINDSRCPTDVVCVRAGEAKVKVDININGQLYSGVELCIQCDELLKIPSVIKIDNYKISLISVNPIPKSTNISAEKSVVMIVE